VDVGYELFEADEERVESQTNHSFNVFSLHLLRLTADMMGRHENATKTKGKSVTARSNERDNNKTKCAACTKVVLTKVGSHSRLADPWQATLNERTGRDSCIWYLYHVVIWTQRWHTVRDPWFHIIISLSIRTPVISNTLPI
jgi:hypothetical protein